MMSVSQRSWCLNQVVRKINDDVNPPDSNSEPHVDLPQNEDTVVSPLVVSSPPTV